MEVILVQPVFDILKLCDAETEEVLQVTQDGRIFWRQREVETDDALRSAMMGLYTVLAKGYA